MKKYLKWVVVGLGAVFLCMQAIQPDRTNPPVVESQTIQALMQVPPSTLSILKRSCFDCHSNETTWPWYSYIAPSSWLVAGDVKNGREKMNFSEWGKLKGLRVISKLDQICMNVDQRVMPLPNYLIMHPGAKPSQAEIDSICAWVETESERLSQ